MGRGTKATTSLSKGDVVLMVPSSVIICKDTLLVYSNSKRVMEVICEEHRVNMGSVPQTEKEKYQFNLHLISMLLMIEYTDPNSYFQPYFRVLPKIYDTPFFWEAADFDELQGTALHGLLHQKRMMAFTFQEYVFPLFQTHFGEESNERFKYDHYQWVLATLWSRCYCIKPDMEVLLVPMADMMNQSPAKDHLNVANYSYDGKHFIVKSCVEYAKGEQVFMTYGDKSNYDFLQSYGITLLDNSNQHIQVILHIPSYLLEPDPFLFRIKEELFHLIGVDPIAISLYADLIPFKLVMAMRIYALKSSDFVSESTKQKIKACLREQQQISLENEIAALKLIMYCCNYTLDMYPTDIDYDTKLLQKLDLLSVSKLVAIRLRITEKKSTTDLEISF